MKLKQRQRTNLQIPKTPVKMDWFEEPNLAKAFYEIIQAEADLELLKQRLALKTDYTMTDVWAIFDTQHSGSVSRLQFEEVYNLLGLYPSREEIMMTFKNYDTDCD